MIMKITKSGISILICTYNREYILSDCLDSLVAQTADKSLYEVIIINNNSSDKTQEIATKYANTYNNFRVIVETNQGLSYARNRGFKEAKYDWVSYVDDDAKAFPNYVERTLDTIEKYGYDCFGGMYYPWYRGTIRPKWLAEDFGQSEKHVDTISLLNETQGITGCVCVFKKNQLDVIGGFPTFLGMTGDIIAYGEEIYVQEKFREFGFLVGFDPGLCIDHLVPEYKQKIAWHIQSAYAQGRDSVKIWNMNNKYSYFQFLKTIIKTFLKQTPKGFLKLIAKKNYYVENLFLDIILPISKSFGYYKGLKKLTN